MEPLAVARSEGFFRLLASPRMRAAAVAIAILLFFTSTLIALGQAPWEDPYAAPKGLTWFLSPRNPPIGLQVIDSHLRTVFALPDNKNIWAGGDLGTLVHSGDAGEKWTKLTLPETPSPAPPEINTKPSATTPTSTTATPTPPPAAFVSPQEVEAGQQARLRIKTQSFRIDSKAPVSAGNTKLITVGPAEPVDDISIIVPVTVDAAAPPGQYTIRLIGTRLDIPGPASQPFVLGAVFDVVAPKSKSPPPQTKAPAEKGAMLFWHLPVVHAQSISPPDRTISAVRFKDEKTGAIIAADKIFTTSDRGFRWSESKTSPRPPGNHGCINSDLGVIWSSGDLLQCGEGTFYSYEFSRKNDRTIQDLRGSGKARIIIHGPPLQGAQFSAIFMLDDRRGWLATTNGILFNTSDGARWKQQANLRSRINGLFFQPDGKRGWAVGSTGSILSTLDGGITWLARTTTKATRYSAPYSAGPAPWYLLSLSFSALLLAIALLPYPTVETAPAIEIIAASDRPLEDERDPDPLAFRPIARSLAYFIRNRRTTPPLNFAIIGPWGSGKTSLMRLLRSELKKHGFRPVWFNAWHHQKEKYLLPSLLETIRQEAVPKVWNRGGLAFRFRLVRSRWQWWFAILALAFISAFAVTAACEYKRSPNHAAPVKTQPNAPFDLADFLKQFGPRGTAILSGIALLATLHKWLSAFGVEPAALLTSSGAGARVSDLEKQTSFRYRFAEEFHQVTKALGPRQMVIFIDDLDRCQPQNTLDVLEAVNFLGSSGECFVVMGMAKELVEEYVARSFTLVSDALNAAHKGASSQTPETLASEYLQKLINIEVPVPQTGGAEMKTLVESLRKSGGAPIDKESGAFLNWVRAAALILLPLLGVLFFGLSGVEAGKWLLKTPPTQLAAATASAPLPTPTPPDTAPPPNITQPSPAPAAEGLETGAFIVPTVRESWKNGWPAFVVLPLIIWAVYRVATWRPDLEPSDSPEFDSAMDDVLPLIVARAGTPRAVKRFVNKVRYIAMRLRQRQSDDRPLWSRLWGRVPVVPTPAAGIPDGALVVLAAIDYWQHSSLDTDTDLEHAIERWPSLGRYDRGTIRAWRIAYLRYASGLNVN